MGDVRGTVTLDGQPLPEGVVRFIPVDGATATAGGTIRDGQFIAKVPVATHRVEISANVIDRQLTPPNPTDEQIVMKQLIPERYNTRSELTLRVVAGSNEPRFDLQSRSTGKE